MRLAVLRLAIFPLLAAVSGGCGSLDSDPTTPSTLATVSGTITNPKSLTVAGDALRVAVVWDAAGQALPDGSYATDHRTSQDIKVTSVFPVSFSLKLAELPTNLQPFKEMWGGDDVDLRGAAGFVVAYEDTNRNGKLDLVGPSSAAFVDHVLGAGSTQLLYLEGTMPADTKLLARAADSSGHVPTLGFSLYVSYCVSGKTPPAGTTCESSFDWASIQTPMALALVEDTKLLDGTKLQEIMCQELASSSTVENGHGNAPGELPPLLPSAKDPNVTCGADGRKFSLKEPCTVSTPPGICQPTTTTCTEEEYVLADGASAPGGWPCTVR